MHRRIGCQRGDAFLDDFPPRHVPSMRDPVNGSPLPHGGCRDSRLILFSLADLRCAVPLGDVKRVLPMMEVTPLPNAPAVVHGVINLAGTVIAVMDLRRRFGLALREPLLSDVLIVARRAQRDVALMADGVIGLIDCPDITPTAALTSGALDVQGVVKLDDGVALITDLDVFLCAAEQEQLADALARAEAGP